MTSWNFHNPPSDIIVSESQVSFRTHPKTDYWHPPDRVAANGHFYYTKAVLPTEYGLHLQCTLRGDWKVTYDQAGIMIRESAEKWIKAGVEFVDGLPYLSSVVANPLSDWALCPYPGTGPLTIRLTAAPGVHSKVHIEYMGANTWVKFREITGWTFGKGSNLDMGVMACSPGDSSIRVEFWDIVAQDYSELAVENGLPKGTIGAHMLLGPPLET